MTAHARPAALVVTGAPGAGKSTLGAALAALLGAALLDQDVLTGPLVAAVCAQLGTDDLDDPRVVAATRAPRYEALTATAEDCLRCGTPAVLVAPFTRERTDPAAWRALSARLRAAGGAPRLVWATVPPAELVRRVRARGAARDAAKLADPAAFLAGLDLAPPVVDHLAVDTTRPLDPGQLGLRTP